MRQRYGTWTVGLAVVLLAAAADGAAAEGDVPPGRFSFRTYGLAEGLGNLAIEEVAQDSEGFLWVATQDGVYRYDGDRFTRFGMEEGLMSPWTTSVATDNRGRLWVGTQSGLARREGERFVTASLADLPDVRVRGLAVDARGRLFVATTQGLFGGGYKDRFKRVRGWPSDQAATAVFAYSAGEGMLYAAYATTVGRRDVAGNWAFWDTGLETGERIDDLVVDKDGRLWISSTRHLLSRAPGDDAFHDETSHVDRLNNAFDRSLLALDGSGNLWVPTDSGLFYRRDQTWLHLGAEQGLPGGWAQGVFHDRDGSLWAWQVGAGLYRLRGRGAWESWTRADGLPGDLVWNVLRDRSGRLWVGTSGGLARATADRWVTAPGTEGLVVRAISEAPNGTLWLGCMPTQAIHFDPRRGVLARFGVSEGVEASKVVDILADRSGGVWIASRGAGLLYKPAGAPRFTRVESPVESAFVDEDSKGRIWTSGGGAGGLTGLGVREGGRWRWFTSADGLLRDTPIHLRETRQGDLWIAYSDVPAVSRIRWEDGELRVLEHVDTTSGLTSSNTYSLGIDHAGRVWRGTGRGVDLLRRDGVQHFDSSDGLVSDDCGYKAFWADANGDIWFGTSRGLSRLRRGGALEEPPGKVPTTVIMQATVGDRPLQGSRAVPSYPHDKNTLQVRFSGMDFVNESHLVHQVRLLGLESEWIDSGSREVRYPGLRPGDYVFEARAGLGRGVWGPPARAAFQILPAWWQTWPVRGLEWALGLGLVVALLRYHVRHLERRRRELESLVAERTSELEAAKAELERLARIDGLTGLANRRAFDESLDSEWRRAARYGTELTLVLLDVDYFKPFNDRYGHPAGDDCLRQVAGLLEGVARRPGDVPARYGGEEFALLLPGVGYEAATVIAEKVRRGVLELAIPHDISSVAAVVSVSIGVANAWPVRGLPAGTVLAAADKALYMAKATGRNRVACPQDEPAELVQGRVA